MAEIIGTSTDPINPGVLGQPMNTNAPNTQAIGVKGDGGAGIPATPAQPIGRQAIGVYGTCSDPSGIGVWGENTAGGEAGSFSGNVAVAGNVAVTGNVDTTGNLQVKGKASVTGKLAAGSVGDVASAIQALQAAVAQLQNGVAQLQEGGTQGGQLQGEINNLQNTCAQLQSQINALQDEISG